MSHVVIIIGQKPPLRTTGEVSPASGRIEWEPAHGMPPSQERRRIERAERKLEEILDILSAPSDSPEE